MEGKTFEGPWEEIARRAAEFEGQHVRLTILDGTEPRMLDQSLKDLLADAESLSTTLPTAPVVHSNADWSEAVAEKYRRQGFEL